MEGRFDRLQIDYDDRGRVSRWRQGDPDAPYYRGTAAVFDYEDDGSYSVQIASRGPWAWARDNSGLSGETRAFCQRMNFDLQGRLAQELWGCDAEVLAREYSYDDQGRLQRVAGHALSTPEPQTQSPAYAGTGGQSSTFVFRASTGPRASSYRPPKQSAHESGLTRTPGSTMTWKRRPKWTARSVGSWAALCPLPLRRAQLVTVKRTPSLVPPGIGSDPAVPTSGSWKGSPCEFRSQF